MTTANWLDHATEIYSETGPTGRFARVLEGKIEDYGGNVLYRGTAAKCAEYQLRLRLPHRLIPTQYEAVEGEVSGADLTWDYVIV